MLFTHHGDSTSAPGERASAEAQNRLVSTESPQEVQDRRITEHADMSLRAHARAARSEDRIGTFGISR